MQSGEIEKIHAKPIHSAGTCKPSKQSRCLAHTLNRRRAAPSHALDAQKARKSRVA